MPASEHILPAVIGYVTPLSAKAGELLEFKISSLGDRDITAKVARLDCCDPNPLGPGPKAVEVEFGLKQRYSAKEQKTYLGSCAVGPVPTPPELRDLTVELLVKPTHLSSIDQTIFSLQSHDGSKGVALVLNNGALYLKRLHSPQATDGLGLGICLNDWTKLQVVLGVKGVSARTSVVETRKTLEMFAPLSGLRGELREVDHICFAAVWTGHPKDCFNGSIEAPHLCSNSQTEPGSDNYVLARWCFGDSGNNEWVEDEIARAASHWSTCQCEPFDRRLGPAATWTGKVRERNMQLSRFIRTI
jgi:N,N-dimethylformamidase